VVVEKPFGSNLVSAQALNCTLHEVFPEAIFRIDHYLGKETIRNIPFFLCNSFLSRCGTEPSSGGGDYRRRFGDWPGPLYEEAGAIRDA
jgi:glucose-6-phosphate 1-dehydrogenase